MDYKSMIYTAPIRDAAAESVVKPHMQETKQEQEKGGASGRSKVSRALQSSLNVITSKDTVEVSVSVNIDLQQIFNCLLSIKE